MQTKHKKWIKIIISDIPDDCKECKMFTEDTTFESTHGYIGRCGNHINNKLLKHHELDKHLYCSEDSSCFIKSKHYIDSKLNDNDLYDEAICDVVAISKLNDEEVAKNLIKEQFLIIDKQDIKTQKW